jgi:tetratricopeptide (TPR) repeat protein
MIVVGTTVDSPAARELGMMVPTLGAQLLTQKYGRDAEREADEYGIRYMAEAGYSAEGAVELQQTFLRLSEGRNQDWLSGLFASHPPSQERVENNRETARALALEGYTAGETGTTKWREQTAYLHRVEPAYKAYDKAREAASQKEWSEAQKHLDTAMQIEPRESLFHALQGDLYAQKEQYKRALNSYDGAVAANPNLFYGWLKRGQTRHTLGEDSAAREDLERSLKLMPTAQAHYLLGELDLKANRKVAALDHFRIAAQSDSATGIRAEREILGQDLPQRAASYVTAQAVVNAKGEVWIQVGNQTRTPLHDIDYRYAWIDDAGQTREGSGQFDGTLEGGKWAQEPIDARISGVTDPSRRVRVEITGAKLTE